MFCLESELLEIFKKSGIKGLKCVNLPENNLIGLDSSDLQLIIDYAKANNIENLFYSYSNASKVEYKKIPIIPMLKPYLNGVTEFNFYVQNRIKEKFHKILPKNRLYDLRTTFYTRCQEC